MYNARLAVYSDVYPGVKILHDPILTVFERTIVLFHTVNNKITIFIFISNSMPEAATGYIGKASKFNIKKHIHTLYLYDRLNKQ